MGNNFQDKIAKAINDEEIFNEKVEYVAENLASKKVGPIKELWKDVLVLWNIVRNPKIPWYSKIMPLVALIYLVSPIDAIPDVIPGGLLDDAGVIITTIASLKPLIDKYIKRKRK